MGTQGEQGDRIGAFIGYMAARGTAGGTLAYYERILRELPPEFTTWDWHGVEGWTIRLKDRLMASTIKTAMGAVSSYYEWEREEDLRENNPVREIPRRCRPKVPSNGKVKAIPWHDVEKMLVVRQIVRGDWAVPVQAGERLAIHLLALTGMRRGEVVNVTVENVNLKEGLIYLEHTKNGDGREVWIDPRLKPLLAAWMAEIKTGLLFGEYGDTPTQRGTWLSGLVRRFARAARIEHNVHPHTFRYSFITHLVHMGLPVKHIQMLAGHRNSRMTLDIYAQVSVEQAGQAVIEATNGHRR